MAFKINSHEFQIAQTHPAAVVRTTVPKEALDQDNLLLDRVRNNGFMAGDHILVQILNDQYETLLHEAEFVVVSAITSHRQIVIDDRRERTSSETHYELARKGEWWDAAPGLDQLEGEAVSVEAPADETLRHRWNPGKKRHEAVTDDGGVHFYSADKNEVLDFIKTERWAA